MAQCEMCGKEANLVAARIEGAELQLCPVCASHGTPVETPQQIARRKFSPRPAIPEIVEDSVTGDLVAPSDHNLMAEKILEFFNDNFKVREYIEAAYDKLKSQFDAKTMAKKYEDLYDKIING